MAARDNQGLQIALILFVMITVVLAVTTYVFFRKSEENKILKEAAQKAADDNQTKARTYQAAYELVRRTVGKNSLNDAELASRRSELQGLGGEVANEVAAIEKRFDDDMKMYGEGLTAQTVSYVDLPQNLVNVINQRNELVDQLRRDYAQLDQQRKNELDAEKAKTAQAAKAQADAQAALDAAQANFEKDRGDLNSEKQKLAAATSEKDKRYKEMQDSKDKRISELATRNEDLNNLVIAKDRQLDIKSQESFDLPSGAVTFVNQSAGTVWINLGTADGLQRNTTFTVYDRDQSNFSRAERKGVIEVTRVVDEHLAEANIVEESNSNPILSNDIIYTPTWSPGEKVRFALTGFMDIDDDTLSDRAIIRSLILTNGGLIDAEVDDDGQFTGQITPATRYLVKGKEATARDPSLSKQLTENHTKIVNDAIANGVEQIDLGKFLTLMGYKPDRRTVKLGREGVDFGADVEGQPAAAAPAGAGAAAGAGPAAGAGAPGATFRERRPPARGDDGGAF